MLYGTVMPKLTVKCSVEELESWKVAAHGELLTLSGWVRAVLTERGSVPANRVAVDAHAAPDQVAAERANPRSVSAEESAAEPVAAGSPDGATRPKGRESAADPVTQAEDWLKARAGRDAKPHPKPGGKR